MLQNQVCVVRSTFSCINMISVKVHIFTYSAVMFETKQYCYMTLSISATYQRDELQYVPLNSISFVLMCESCTAGARFSLTYPIQHKFVFTGGEAIQIICSIFCHITLARLSPDCMGYLKKLLANDTKHNKFPKNNGNCLVIFCVLLLQTLLIYRNITHWGRDKLAAMYQTTCSNAFSWMKMYQFR